MTKVALAAIVLLFGFLLVGNIDKPLLWADESMTAMFASRVLDYGYPKVHDERGNAVYDAELTAPSLGIDAENDAILVNMYWMQYYFTAPFVWMARQTDDIYLKTLLLRLPFAVTGMLGLLVVFLSISPFFSTSKQRWEYATLYGLLGLISITMLLHLREVRYYSLNILFLGFFLNLFVRGRVFRTLPATVYVSLMGLLQVSIFLLYFPFYFTAVATLAVAEGLLWLTGGSFTLRRWGPGAQDFLWGLLPILVTVPIIIPLLNYSRVFKISADFSKHFQFNSEIYFNHISSVSNHLQQHEFLLPALFAKVCVILSRSFFLQRRESTFSGAWVLSMVLAAFTVVYILIIAQVPFYVFIRYFILIIPVLNLGIALDTLLIFRLLNAKYSNAQLLKYAYSGLGGLLFLFTFSTNLPLLEGKFYEATHPYLGPLDVAIPYIKNRFKNTRNLLVATNYEDSSLMYYLDCNIAVGFSGIHKTRDSTRVPDIIFYRKWYGNHVGVFNYYLNKTKYERVEFPIVDTPVNTISELNFPGASHQFKTLFTKNEPEQVHLYIKK
ncbi:MAG: hypothetical protein H7Y12_02660 [Sphingobacteriaceae bacterium]|nr:hypothetical protein [Cytophagaceae bacterium]